MDEADYAIAVAIKYSRDEIQEFLEQGAELAPYNPVIQYGNRNNDLAWLRIAPDYKSALYMFVLIHKIVLRERFPICGLN